MKNLKKQFKRIIEVNKNFCPIVLTNYNNDKIKTKIIFDFKMRLYRIDVKLIK